MSHHAVYDFLFFAITAIYVNPSSNHQDDLELIITVYHLLG